jgi:hypothetical protein
MAYTAFFPSFLAQESQDAMQLKITDNSVWNGESGFTTIATVEISYYDENDVLINFDPYELIVGADATKFNEFLDRTAGHVIELSSLTIGGVAAPDRFPEGYYIIKISFSEGSYAVGTFPYFENPQAFLAKWKFMTRTMVSDLLVFPMTDEIYRINRDIFLQRIYLDMAENAADYGKVLEFKNFATLIQGVFDYYSVVDTW